MLNANVMYMNRSMVLGETRSVSLCELANIAAFVLSTVTSIALAMGIAQLIALI